MNRPFQRRWAALTLAASLPCAASPLIDSIQGDWLHLAGAYPGVDGEVKQIQWKDHDLWVRGDFTRAGSSKISRLARFRQGEGWMFPGLDSWKEPNSSDPMSLNHFAFAPDGKLWVAGRVGSVYADPVLRSFDGKTWTDYSNEFSCKHYQVGVCKIDYVSFDGDSNPIATGTFRLSASDSTYSRTVRRVNGIWQAFQPDTEIVVRWGADSLLSIAGHGVWIGTSASRRLLGMDSATAAGVRAKSVYHFDDGSVVVVGSDTLSLRTLVGKAQMALWNGSTWKAIGDTSAVGKAQGFNATTVLKDSDGRILAIGYIYDIPHRTRMKLLKWREDRWDTLASSSLWGTYQYETFTGLSMDTDGRLALCGKFTSTGTVPALNLAIRDANGWHATDSGFAGVVNTIAYDRAGGLVVGGSFTGVAGRKADNIARWDGTSWSPLGDGLDGPVYGLTTHPDGGVVATGAFQVAGKELVNYIARWDGAKWTGIGTGLTKSGGAVAVDSLGGIWSGPANKSPLVRWNGKNWFTAFDETGDFLPFDIAISKNNSVRALYGANGSSVASTVLVASPDAMATIRRPTNKVLTNVAMTDVAFVSDSVFAYAGQFNSSKWPLAIESGSQFTYPDLPFEGSGTAVAADSKGTLFLGGELKHSSRPFSVMRWKDSLATKILGLDGAPKTMITDSEGRLVVAGSVFNATGGSLFVLRNPQASPVGSRQIPTSREALRQVGRDLVATKGGNLEILRPDGRVAWSGQIPAGFSTARLALSPGLHIARMDATTLRFLVPMR